MKYQKALDTSIVCRFFKTAFHTRGEVDSVNVKSPCARVGANALGADAVNAEGTNTMFGV